MLFRSAQTGRTSQPFVKPIPPVSYENAVAQQVAEDLAKFGEQKSLIAPYTAYAKTGKTSQPFVKPVKPLSAEEAIAQEIAENIAKGNKESLIAPFTKTGKLQTPVKPVQPEVIDDFGKYFANLPVAEQQKLYAEIASTGQLRSLDRIANPNGVFKINTQVKAPNARRSNSGSKTQPAAATAASGSRIASINEQLAKYNLKLNVESYNNLSRKYQQILDTLLDSKDSAKHIKDIAENSPLFIKA